MSSEPDVSSVPATPRGDAEAPAGAPREEVRPGAAAAGPEGADAAPSGGTPAAPDAAATEPSAPPQPAQAATEAAPAPDADAQHAWAAADAAAKDGGWVSAEAAAEETGGDAAIPVEADEDAPASTPHAPASSARLAAEARGNALARFARELPRGSAERVEWLAGAFDRGLSPVFLGRFRREATGGLDERHLFGLRRAWRAFQAEETRRAEIRERLVACAALTDDLAAQLRDAPSVAAMEDVAAPWLPVAATRATVARGRGLQALADAIRAAKEPTPLSDLAAPFVREGTEVASLDAALAGARDVLAEELGLDARLRARLREAFRREPVLTVTLRPERKGDAGRHGALVGFTATAGKVPPLKWLAIRRGERERVLQSTLEPPEAKAIAIVHESVSAAFGDGHPYAGFLRAAAEDGYRRILRPALTRRARDEHKARADGAAIETFERSLRNLLLGAVGGPRPTLGVQPDVAGGHRVGAVDAQGRTVHVGRLPHEPTAGREAAVAALRALVESHAIEAVAVGTSAGRKEALSIAEEATRDLGREVVVAEVADGGTRALEAAAIAKPVKTDLGAEVPPESVGALSIARRFQDPMAEYVRLDPRSLGLGPNLHDVHQGHLAEMFEDAIASCVGHAGVDASTADADLLAHLPGLDRGRARAYVAWRDGGGRLVGKAALAAVDGIGPGPAEQAVGFLRVPGTKDPRDRTMLHPEQYGLVDEMAAQVGAPIAQLFLDGRLRSRVDLGRLARPDAPLPTLKYVLWQLATGLVDPRPRYAVPTRPPPEMTFQTLRPGLLLEGRVVRAVPFGVFVDVGLGVEALVPLPHIGDRPGVDPATIAPVGAVVHGRVLEVDPVRRRIALSLRTEVVERGDRPPGPPRGRGPDGGRRPFDRPGGPPRGAREPATAGGPGRAPREGGGAPAPRDRGPSGGGRPDARPAGAAAGPRRVVAAPTRLSSPPRVGGGIGGGRDRRDGGRRYDRDDPGAPRKISLPQDAPAPADAGVDESALSPAELLARKLDELKRRIARPE